MVSYHPVIHQLHSNFLANHGIELSVLRLDLIHPIISGNKWFKLKYNLEEARKNGINTVLTFGGAYSNHIHATAAACKEFGFKSIGIIRGEEDPSNPTLNDAKAWGMKFVFVSREEYKRKKEKEFVENLRKELGEFYLIPEGGDNIQGAMGCAEILQGLPRYDYVLCACGTGTTFAGLSKWTNEKQKLIGISVLKGEQTSIPLIREMAGKINPEIKICNNEELMADEVLSNSGILNHYALGGYAKHTTELLQFKNDFEQEYKISLDFVYTSKLFYATFDLIEAGKIPAGSKVLAIHSGGLQGNRSYKPY